MKLLHDTIHVSSADVSRFRYDMMNRCTSRSEVAEWLAHWLLMLEVPGSISAAGKENLLV